MGTIRRMITRVCRGYTFHLVPIAFLSLFLIALPGGARADNATLNPNSSSYDTSDSSYISPSDVNADDTNYDAYSVPGSYNESIYQAFYFDFPSITDPIVAFELSYIYYGKKVSAKVELVIDGVVEAEVDLISAGGKVDDYVSQIDLTQWYPIAAADLSTLEIRFLAESTGGGQAETDWVNLYVSWDSMVPPPPPGGGGTVSVDGRLKLWEEPYEYLTRVLNPQTPGDLYFYHDTTAGYCYYLLAVDRGFNDNVFSDSQTYLKTAGWGKGHTFGDLEESDNARFTLYDGASVLYDFDLGYVGSDGSEWVSGLDDIEGALYTDNCGTIDLATELLAASSLEWNLENSDWASGWSTPGSDTWDSPSLDYNFTSGSFWEFQMIYELGFPDDCGCGSAEVSNAHNSPAKEEDYTPPWASIGDFVWHDENEDGIQDSGEYGLEGVVLHLYQETSPGSGEYVLIRTTQTDGRGWYIFAYLDGGAYGTGINYYVDVDEGSIPWTYEQTTITDQNRPNPGNGHDPPDDEAFIINLRPGDAYREADFGYDWDLTVAVISSFAARTSRQGDVVVEWETTSEVGTVGFHLLRLDEETGEYRRVNEKLIPGLLHSPQGGLYSVIDKGASPGGTCTYRLVEVWGKGKRRSYGPFTVEAGGGEMDSPGLRAALSSGPHTGSAHSRKAREVPADTKKRLRAWKDAKQSLGGPAGKARLQGNGSGKAAGGPKKKWAKVAVSEKGLYYLDAGEIASVLNIPPRAVTRMIRQNRLRIDNRGRTVAYLPARGRAGLYFYGEGLENLYTEENIYWLGVGRKGGVRMGRTGRRGPPPARRRGSFSEIIHLEEDHWALTSLFEDPQEDFWLWEYILSGNPALGSKSFTLRADGAAPVSETATLTVRLKGATDCEASPDHHAVVSLNGTEIGGSSWEGAESHEFDLSFSQALLNEGDNTLEVRGVLDTGAPYSIFYVDSFDLAYQKLYQAEGNALLCRGDGNPVVTITGFTSPGILLFEITDPTRPKLVTAVTRDRAAGSYRVSFRPVSPEALYLAVTRDGMRTPESMVADVGSQLRRKNNAWDYLVITPAELKEAAQALADYRQGQGLESMVVDLEDIYDEFNFGISSPEAVRDFLSFAHNNWRKSPGYVVLAGEGTYDYKDCMGLGGNLVPPLLVGTPHGLFASDNRFADVEGDDGVPEMAIGRLPVLTDEELRASVEKMIAYESAGGEWTNRVLMLADNPDGGGDFPADSDNVAALLPPEYTADKIYLSAHGIDEARRLVREGINSGAVLMNYIGHAALDSLAQEGMLTTSDVDSLANGDRLPVVTAMTCVAGRFALPGFDCVSEALVLKSDGGAVAVWSPTGLSNNAEAMILNEEFFKAVFQDGDKIIGDVVLGVLQEFAARGGSPYMLAIYNLLGDPALEMR